MPVAADYALEAIVRGLGQGGALNVAQTEAIFYNLEVAAARLDDTGMKTYPQEIRDIIDFVLDSGEF